MVDTKRYNPSNKRFQKHTQSFVEGKTLKGHLGEGDKEKGKYKETGELIRVNRQKILEDGWEVKINKKTVFCTYGDNIVYLPKHKTTEMYYIPLKKCEVEVSIDEKSKIKTITRIKDDTKQPIEMDYQGITLKGNGTASIEVKQDFIEIGDENASIKVKDNATKIVGDQLSVQNDIKVDTTKDKDLPDEISITDMYKKIQILEQKISDTDDS